MQMLKLKIPFVLTKLASELRYSVGLCRSVLLMAVVAPLSRNKMICQICLTICQNYLSHILVKAKIP